MRLIPLLFLLSLSACKDEGEPVDTDPADADTDTDADTDADSDTDADTDTDTDADTDTDTECWVAADIGECYDCEPPTSPTDDSLEFLNACTDADYVTFDNASRIPSTTWQEGDPLPEVP